MKKRTQIRRHRIRFLLALCGIVCFLCGFIFRGSITTAYADSDSSETNTAESVSGSDIDEIKQNLQGCKYYTSVTVETGDSLYSIASKYYTENYESIEKYIYEIKKVNGIRSDNICQGGYLTIPYYSEL